jgi:hypothetical protein
LRRDGFVSLDAGDPGGSLTTQLFTHSGGHLYLNGVASTGGSITCELLDATDQPLAGFEQANCSPLVDDSTRFAVTWGEQQQLPDGPLRLRFHLRNASLYSYWVEP